MKYRLFGVCVPVEGFLRTAVYDLQTGDYHFMPNDFQHLLNDGSAELEESILFDTFKQQSMLFGSEDVEETERLAGLGSDDYDYPSFISNAIVELDGSCAPKKIFDMLCNLRCTTVQVVAVHDGPAGAGYLISLLNEVRHSIIRHLELVIMYTDLLPVKDFLTTNEMTEVKAIFVHGAPAGQTSQKVGKTRLYFSTDVYSYATFSLKRNPKLFFANTLLFVESLHYNNYYNRKLFIHKTGNVKNGPESSVVFGNINDDGFDLEATVKGDEFRQPGLISKDHIHVCNVCEFKYMCIDSRIPVKNREGQWWYHLTECNYNPFIARWDIEHGYMSLEACGVTLEENGISINYETLKRVLKELYRVEFDWAEEDQPQTTNKE